MTDTLHTIKQRVRELSPYTLSRAKARIKLNQNENPWVAPLRIKEEVLRRLAERRWSQYPDFVPESLHRLLAEHSGWTPDGIIAGNGSNELIQAVLMVTLAEGKRVQFRSEFFNLFNHPNFNLPDSFLGSPTFGVISSARDPRHIQFGLKLLF